MGEDLARACGVIVSGDPPEAQIPFAVLFALKNNVSFKQAMH
jgi:hypothetical protein